MPLGICSGNEPPRQASGRSRHSSCSFGHLGRLGELMQVWMSPVDGRESSNAGRSQLADSV